MMQSAPQKLITLIGLVTTDLNVFLKVGLSLKNKTVLVFLSSRYFPMLFRPILKYVVMQTVHETAMKIVQLWLRFLTENGRPLAVCGCRPIKSV